MPPLLRHSPVSATSPSCTSSPRLSVAGEHHTPVPMVLSCDLQRVPRRSTSLSLTSLPILAFRCSPGFLPPREKRSTLKQTATVSHLCCYPPTSICPSQTPHSPPKYRCFSLSGKAGLRWIPPTPHKNTAPEPSLCRLHLEIFLFYLVIPTPILCPLSFFFFCPLSYKEK